MRASGRTLTLGEFTDLIINTRGDRFDSTPVRVLTKDGEELDVVGAVFGNDQGVLIEIGSLDDIFSRLLVKMIRRLAEQDEGDLGRKAHALAVELEVTS